MSLFHLHLLYRISSQLSQRFFSIRIINTITMDQILKPPEEVYLMKDLNKNAFEKVIKVPVINIKGVKVSSVLPLVKKCILKLENFKAINHLDEGKVLIYLNPTIIQKWTDFSQDVISQLDNLNLTENVFEIEDLTLYYENFTVEAILRAVLPKDKEGVSSFTIMGHIVHLNLREHLIPYKNIIGEVLFDKIKGCKSVVNKVNMIDNTYRNFQMEVLKGDNNMHTTVKENNCKFDFDFSTVYWNSRLCTEHERIVKCLKKDDVFFDVFAGVGPFSIPAAKKKCKVFANDLNPESYKWLMHNKNLNKISDEDFSGFNLDGRDFILTIIKENLPKYIVDHNVVIAMNLPALAVEFLDSFIGLLKNVNIPETFKPVTVYVYCFAKGQSSEEIAKNLIYENLKVKGVNINSKIIDIFNVRTVSSMKEMVRVTLSLDRDILVGVCNKRKFEGDNGSNLELKKLCNRVDEKNGEEQEEKQQRIQSSGSQEFEIEGQGESSEKRPEKY